MDRVGIELRNVGGKNIRYRSKQEKKTEEFIDVVRK